MQFFNKSDKSNIVVSLATVTFLLILVGITIFYFVNYTKQATADQIITDIELLGKTFKKIDETAVIRDFNSPKSTINYLNIKKGGFVGSEVGPMNLVHPDKWEGPYFRDNPMIENKEYQVVKTRNGYYVVPGDGVKLPNGKIMGTDVIIDQSTDIEELTKSGNDLNYKDRPLATFIPTAASRIAQLADDLIITDQEM